MQEYLIHQYTIESIKKEIQKLRENKMIENYIMLNGKRVDLTEEQLEKLGLKVEKKDCFERKYNQMYYFTGDYGTVKAECDSKASEIDSLRHSVANYCTDKALIEQRALHETLSRLLWRFSMQNDGDRIDWDNGSCKYFITYDYRHKEFKVDYYQSQFGCTLKNANEYFYSAAITKRAIDEIVLPFIKEHPEFVW